MPLANSRDSIEGLILEPWPLWDVLRITNLCARTTSYIFGLKSGTHWFLFRVWSWWLLDPKILVDIFLCLVGQLTHLPLWHPFVTNVLFSTFQNKERASLTFQTFAGFSYCSFSIIDPCFTYFYNETYNQDKITTAFIQVLRIAWFLAHEDTCNAYNHT